MSTSRMKNDYEFLQKLEVSIETHDIPAEADESTDESQQNSNDLLKLVKDGIVFLDNRAEFWTNMK